MERHGRQGPSGRSTVRLVTVCSGRLGGARRSEVWCGAAGKAVWGMSGQGTVRSGSGKAGKLRLGPLWIGAVWLGLARQAWLGRAARG